MWHPNPPPWPNGARSAVAFSFDVDADSVVHARFRGAALDDPFTTVQMRYDPFVGTPRLARLMGEQKVPATWFVPGWVADTYPASVEAILQHAGNEIGHHGYYHEWPSEQSEAEERRTFENGLKSLEKLTGKLPVGYRAPYYGISHKTFDILIEAGFLYDGSLYADDVPVILDNGRGRILELSAPASIDDYSQYVSSRAIDHLINVRSASEALQVYRDEFDAIHEAGGLFVSVWHPAVSGRPAQAVAIRSLIEHMKQKGGVWFATMGAIAEHVRGLERSGRWTPRTERIPVYREPVLGGRRTGSSG
jgi:peptidoglycan/xylan/chitin deacetylase (PgdA/CDA1 family)